MPRITWDDTFSVHNAEIDEQHKQWIAIINDLYNAMDSEKGISKRAIIQALKAVDHYTRFHFADEEAFMLRVNYPEYEAHKKLHEAFLKVVGEYMDDIERERVIIDEVMSVLTKWFPKHILKEDKKLSSYGDH
ncbi:MAG: bacteriohemerythrin [Mariprofundaceae bacterium]